jgi:hypothetical protein
MAGRKNYTGRVKFRIKIWQIIRKKNRVVNIPRLKKPDNPSHAFIWCISKMNNINASIMKRQTNLLFENY